jgi:two-component system, cell cycle sensor histidine kinase and response regulator CckA
VSDSPEPFSPHSPSTAAARKTTAAAILMLDDDGCILSTNTSAGAYWSCLGEELVGRSFVSLFAFEVVSDDPDILDAQWEVLRASATEQRVPMAIQIDEDGPSTEVRVELEPAAGGGTAWLARVTREATVNAPPPPEGDVALASAANATTGSDVWARLAHSDAAGFFDLSFSSGDTYYSPAWKGLLGYKEADLANTYDTWLKLIHPEDSTAAPDQVGRHSGSPQRSFAVELRMKHRRGHWVWIHCVGVQHFASDGELDRVVGFHLDISERKEVEEQGIVAEDRLRRLTEDGGLAVFDLDFVTGQASVSPAWQDLIGDPVEHPDIGLFTQYLKDSAGDVTGFLSNFGSGDETWDAGPATLRRSDRREVEVMLGLNRQVSRRGELLRVVGFALLLPDSLLASPSAPPFAFRGFDTNALNVLSEGIIVTDRRGNVAVINQPALNIMKLNPGLAMEQPLADVFQLVTPPDNRPADDALELALAAEGPDRLYTDHAVVVTDAAPRPIVWTISQLWDDNREVAGIVVVFRDPAEMSLTPEEIIRANRFDSLGHLAGGIAHDFNNLLSTILGGISLAKDNREYEKLNDAEAACMTAKTLTRQLLAFAKGNPGGTFSVVKPGDILADAVRVAAAGSPVQVTVDLDASAPLVEVDRGQMIQVFQNLIINAMQAMDVPSRGTIDIRCRGLTLAAGQLPSLPQGDYVQIEVQDNGNGIPADKIDRIFEPFFTTKKSGTGLGLATVLSIVRKHGGQLGVDSTVGVGTTFTAFLPATTKDLEAGIRRPATIRFGTGRVLFMDDEPQLCTITRAMLESLDYKVDVARNGEEALTFYRKYHAVNRPYDVVLLDLTIVGGMGGEETFKRLREIDPDVRAIVSSGYDNEEMARQFLEAGFCGYLTKPYRVAELGQMLKSVLGS